MTLRISALTGSLWVPSPRAMNELWNGWPSMVPRTLTRPLVPKYATDSGQTRYVQPPSASLRTSVAVNSLFIRLGRLAGAELIAGRPQGDELRVEVDPAAVAAFGPGRAGGPDPQLRTAVEPDGDAGVGADVGDVEDDGAVAAVAADGDAVGADAPEDLAALGQVAGAGRDPQRARGDLVRAGHHAGGEVLDAEQPRHLGRGRTAEDLGARAGLEQAAAVDDEDLVG